MNTLNELLVHPVFQRLGWTLVHSVWQGAANALLVAIALAMLGRRSSQARYIVSCGGLLLMFAALVVTFFVLPGPIVRHDVKMPTAVVNAQTPMLPMFTIPVNIAAPAPQSPTLAQRLQPLLPLCAALWIIGIAIISIRHVGGWVRVQQLRQRATPLVGEPWDELMPRICAQLRVHRVVKIAESALVQVPSVVGYLKPIILMPACAMTGLSSQQLEGLIAHELAHVRRHDYLVNLVQIVIETLLFYHPAAWWLSKRIRQERENCCDDLAASVCGNRIAYVQALAAMEELRMVPGELVLGARGANLLPRVRRLLGVQSPRQRSWSLTAAIVVVIVALVPLLVAQHKAKAEEAKPTTQSSIVPEDLEVPTYAILPNDLLSVKLTDLVGPSVETTKNARVSKDGEFPLPFDHKAVIGGKTIAEAEKTIQESYKDLQAKIQVQITVVEARGHKFSVTGAVAQPGEYENHKDDLRLRDALDLAGGIKDSPGPISIFREALGGKDPTRVIEVPIAPLLKGDEKLNVVIRPKDVINVPHPVVGEKSSTQSAQPATSASSDSTDRLKILAELMQSQLADNERALKEAQDQMEDLRKKNQTADRRYEELAVKEKVLESNRKQIQDRQSAVSSQLEGRAQADPLAVAKAPPISPEMKQLLDKKLPEVNFQAVSLSDAIDFFRDVTGANIVVNWKQLEAVKIDQNAPVTVRVNNVSFEKALQLVLESASTATAQLGFIVDDNVIRIGSADAANSLKRRDALSAQLEALKQRSGANSPLVTAVQNELDSLDQRIADLKAGAAEKGLVIDPQMKALLEKKLPEVNFEGVAFSDVTDFLRDVTVTNIFVNWNALEAAGIDRNTPVTLKLRNVAFGKVLDLLLASVSGGSHTTLAYTADQGVISISAVAVPDAAVLNVRNRINEIALEIAKLQAQGVGPNHPGLLKLLDELAILEQRPVVSSDRKTPASPGPATQPAKYRAVRIVVGPQKMTLDGKETTWEDAKKQLLSLPSRGECVLEVAVASDQMTLKQQQDAIGQARTLANELKLKYLSDVGIEPLGSKGGEPHKLPATQQGKDDTPPDVSKGGEYYVGGHVVRPGVYSIASKPRLRQALLAAGIEDGTWIIRVVRKKPDHTQQITEIALSPEDMRNKDFMMDRYVQIDDQVMVAPIEAPKAGAKVLPVPTTKPS